jgi:predicted negative regulator of RcsB-dependent stress response
VARQRLTQKEIKQPDQFISIAVRTLEWAKTHVVHLLYGAVGVVVVVALIVAWSAWQTSRHESAEVLLYEAVKLLEANAATGEGKQTASPDQDSAVQKLKRIVREYGGTPAASMAHWHLGHYYYAQADFGAALSSYQQAQESLGRDEQRLLPALVTLNIAFAQEASGACEQAVASFDKVLQSPVVWLHGEAFLGTGRCHESMGAIGQAQQVYAQALSGEAVQGAIRQRLEERQSALKMKQGASGGSK